MRGLLLNFIAKQYPATIKSLSSFRFTNHRLQASNFLARRCFAAESSTLLSHCNVGKFLDGRM